MGEIVAAFSACRAPLLIVRPPDEKPEQLEAGNIDPLMNMTVGQLGIAAIALLSHERRRMQTRQGAAIKERRAAGSRRGSREG
jgi:hypothetical protein